MCKPVKKRSAHYVGVLKWPATQILGDRWVLKPRFAIIVTLGLKIAVLLL